VYIYFITHISPHILVYIQYINTYIFNKTETGNN